MLEIELTNQQSRWPIDERQLVQATREILTEEGVRQGAISVVLVDDAQIRQLNARYLEHDWATDTLSFVLEQDDDYLEGEVILSVEMAARQAEQYGWRGCDELLLYLTHAVLHLAGYDDLEDAAREEMRRRERYHLSRYGLTPRYESAGSSAEPRDEAGGGAVP